MTRAETGNFFFGLRSFSKKILNKEITIDMGGVGPGLTQFFF